MKKIILTLVLIAMSVNVALAKGGGGGHASAAHAFAPSHMPAHVPTSHIQSSNTCNYEYVCENQTHKNEGIGLVIAFFTFSCIAIFAVIWSGE